MTKMSSNLFNVQEHSLCSFCAALRRLRNSLTIHFFEAKFNPDVFSVVPEILLPLDFLCKAKHNKRCV